MRLPIPAIALALCAGPALSQDYPLRLPAPGGEVILPTALHRKAHDQYRYAAVRRAGDTLYLSGVIVYRKPGEGTDAAAFKLQVRRALEELKLALEASGAGFEDVVMINSFHVWDGPNFTGTKAEQFAAFEEALGDYMKPPYAAWTAVGTSGTLVEPGIVEIQLIAHAPVKK